MFVCPLGFGLIAFCTNLLGNLQIHQLNCKNQPLDIEHSECCDIERTHLVEHCGLFQYSFRSWTKFLQSRERNWKYLESAHHRSDLVGDELMQHLQIQDREGLPLPLFPRVFGRYIGDQFYDRSDIRSAKAKEYATPLNNGLIVCFKRRKANNPLCHPQVSLATFEKTETICQIEFITLYYCKCENKRQNITLDLSKFLRKASVTKPNSDFIVKIPSLKEAPLCKKKFYLKKGAKQIAIGSATEMHSGNEEPWKSTLDFEPSFSLYDNAEISTRKTPVAVSKKLHRPLPTFVEKTEKQNSETADIVKITFETSTLFEDFPLPFTTTTTTPKPKVTSKFKKTTTTTVSPYFAPHNIVKEVDKKVFKIAEIDIGRPLTSNRNVSISQSTKKPLVKVTSSPKIPDISINYAINGKTKGFQDPKHTDQRATEVDKKKKKTLNFYDIVP